MLNLIKKSKKLIIKGALKLNVFLVLFSLFFSSLALAEPTFIANFNVQDKETSPTGITFNPDGTKMFITGINMRKILQYNLTTAFDVTSAAFEKSVLIQVEQDAPQDVKFNSDGTVIFLLGTGTGVIDGVDAARNGIHRWSLSTPYDIGSITPANTTFTEVGGDNPRGLAFNNDGTKMFILDNTAQRVEEYNLSTPYNPDTKGSVANTLGNARSASHQGLGFNNDGSKIFIVKQDNKIDEYALSTAFDLSSATLTGTVSPTFPVTNKRISGFAFNSSGTKMYHLDWHTGADSDNVNEYALSCPFAVVSSSTCEAPQKNKDVRGVVDAQINTAKNFAKDSSQSALKRLSILRANKYYNASAQNIELNFQNELLKKVSNNVLSSTQAKLNPLQKLDQILPNDWEVWSEGSISFGKIGESSLSSAQDIDSLGITVGVDTKMDDDKILGVALRVGSTDVDVGTFGSKVDTNALSLSVYGINSLENSNYLKHVFGVSYLDSDIARKYDGNTDANTGEREGKQVFGSLNFGKEYENGDLIITPTGRINGSYTTLNGYTESGIAALSYNDQDIKSLMSSLGVLIDQNVDLEDSTVRSRINLEYGKEFASSSKVVTSYISDSESFEYQADNKNRDIYTAGLGFDFKHDQGLTISTDYERQQIKGHGYINKFTLSAGFLFRKETEFALGLDEDMTSSFKISKALGVFDLEFDLENNFSNQENHNANLTLLNKF
ncbi:autotransporter domain-containing protein [Candidatus Pelagibacter sp.]|nr:autotransporter domain-containing protein [Candidatus Pelagibacter sp.]MDC6476280.1 autotransporter domain-containing protein [Candidatus Pelagibacter sp.]